MHLTGDFIQPRWGCYYIISDPRVTPVVILSKTLRVLLQFQLHLAVLSLNLFSTPLGLSSRHS